MMQEIQIQFSESMLIGQKSTLYALNLEQLYFYQDKGVVLPDTLQHAVLKRQVEFAAGRFCASEALQQLGYMGKQTLAIGLHRSPVWPDNYLGSISHSDGLALAVVASRDQCQAMGVDIERMLSKEVATPLFAQIMTRVEYAFGNQREVPLSEWCTLVFSAKETLFKTLYPLVGRYFDFLDAEVCALEQNCLILQLAVDLSHDCRQGDRFTIQYYRHYPHIITFCVLA